MSLKEVILGAVLGAAVNEASDVSPWLARRVVPAAARLWASSASERAVRSEEWLALIEDCPGKLSKIGLAGSFLCAGAVRLGQRSTLRAVRWPARTLRVWRIQRSPRTLVVFEDSSGTVTALFGADDDQIHGLKAQQGPGDKLIVHHGLRGEKAVGVMSDILLERVDMTDFVRSELAKFMQRIAKGRPLLPIGSKSRS